jgi:alkylation response protein AidB-like acyl-CoA dehydrogenase
MRGINIRGSRLQKPPRGTPPTYRGAPVTRHAQLNLPSRLPLPRGEPIPLNSRPEQIQLRKIRARICRAGNRPHVMEWDEDQIFPLEVIKKARPAGLHGRHLSGRTGRRGARLHRVLHHHRRTLARGSSVGIIVAAHNSLCTNHICRRQRRAARASIHSQAGTGEWIGCWSLTEPEAGSDAGGHAHQARRRTARAGCSTAAKTFTTNAITPTSAWPWRSPTAPPRSTASRRSSRKGRARFPFGKKENKLGMRASATGEVIFENCRIPADAVARQARRRLRG